MVNSLSSRTLSLSFSFTLTIPLTLMLQQHKQGGGLLRMFNDSLKKALASSIPELKGMDAT